MRASSRAPPISAPGRATGFAVWSRHFRFPGAPPRGLGPRRGLVVRDVILPLSLPGVAAGCLLVFIPAVGEFVIPDLLGGPGTLRVGTLLWQEFFYKGDW